jgi:hypothetical protein
MKQFILMNKEGELGLGVKMCFFGGAEDQELMNLEGYSVRLVNKDDFDLWAIFQGKMDEDFPWIMCKKELIANKMEVLGEL